MNYWKAIASLLAVVFFILTILLAIGKFDEPDPGAYSEKKADVDMHNKSMQIYAAITGVITIFFIVVAIAANDI
jgi:hypothetical protein